MQTDPKKRKSMIKVINSMKVYLRYIIILALITILCAGFVSAIGSGAATEDKANITHTDDGKILMSNNLNWIKIDPVSDIIIGNPFIITGTTNLPIGSTITGQLFIRTNPCHQKTCNIDFSTYGNSSIVLIRSGANSSNNTFSIPIYTKNLISSTDYFFQIDSSIGSYADNKIVFPEIVKKQIQSYILPSLNSHDQYWIWINPLSDETATHVTIEGVDPVFQLTGSTNIPVGENIPYSIISYNYFDVRSPERDWTISLAKNRGHITPSEKMGINSFTVDVDASEYCPGSYYVILWNPRYNASDPNAFLSASTAFGFRENANLSTISSCPTTPTYPLTIIVNGSPITVFGPTSPRTTTPIPLSTTTPWSVIGALAALICSFCIFVVGKKWKNQ
jgi:hypothetical protein